MSAFFATFFQTALEFVILLAIAVAGVMAGKKFRDKKESQSKENQQ
jgi:membrane protein implicated in regulation of membrane protease activity